MTLKKPTIADFYLCESIVSVPARLWRGHLRFIDSLVDSIDDFLINCV